MSRILFVALAALAFVVGVGVAIGSRGGDGGGGDDDKPEIPTWPAVERAPASQAKDKPNIVFIYSDDQNASDFKRRFMPLTYDRLVDGGTNFSNFVVAAPVCCPSRVGFMTGDYPHNSGVYMNHDGFPSMRAKDQNIGSWMQRAGYHTAWLGKFLQGYKRVIPDPNVPAPGWDSWQVSLRANYFGWELFTKHGTQHGGPNDYYTDALTRRASRFSQSAWNNVTFTGGETRDPGRTLPRALFLGTTSVVVLYLLANLAYLVSLPFAEIQHAPQDRVGTAAMEAALGPRRGT